MADDVQGTGTASTDAGVPQTTDAAAAAAAAPGATTGTPAAEAKTEATATQAAAKEPPKEVEYTFDAPEGVELDKAQVDQFKALAKDLNLPADKAKAIADIAIKAEVQRREAFAAQTKAWGDAVAADKELGSPENQALARKAIDTFGTPELREILNVTGLGNHPEMVRLALRIGKSISEDKVLGKSAGEAPARDFASLLYPTTAKA